MNSRRDPRPDQAVDGRRPRSGQRAERDQGGQVKHRRGDPIDDGHRRMGPQRHPDVEDEVSEEPADQKAEHALEAEEPVEDEPHRRQRSEGSTRAGRHVVQRVMAQYPRDVVVVTHPDASVGQH